MVSIASFALETIARSSRVSHLSHSKPATEATSCGFELSGAFVEGAQGIHSSKKPIDLRFSIIVVKPIFFLRRGDSRQNSGCCSFAQDWVSGGRSQCLRIGWNRRVEFCWPTELLGSLNSEYLELRVSSQTGRRCARRECHLRSLGS